MSAIFHTKYSVCIYCSFSVVLGYMHGILKVLSEPENFTEVLLNKLKKQNKKKEPFQYAMGL